VGCLEAYASTAALVRTFIAEQASREMGTTGDVKTAQEEVTGRYIVEQYKKGDPLAVKCLNQHCDYLGHGIAGFINVFSPQRVVIGVDCRRRVTSTSKWLKKPLFTTP